MLFSWYMWAYGRVKPGNIFDRGELSGCPTGNSPMTMSVFFRWGFRCKKLYKLHKCSSLQHLFEMSNYMKENTPHWRDEHWWGSVIMHHVQIRLLGLLWDHISSSWPGADELLRCALLKALGKCRWDHRQLPCVWSHDCEQSILTQILYKY